MFVFSGFGDEIGPELELQLKTLASENVKHLELRGVWGKGVLDLTDEEWKEVKRQLDDHGFGLSAIGSPIGKIRMDEAFEPHFDRFKRAVEAAHFFGTPNIRMFSYYPPKGENIAEHRDDVMKRTRAAVEYAEANDVICCHENEGGIYGEGPKACLDLIETIKSPALRNVFDPANYVIAGYHPYDDCWGLLKDCTEYFHIKDAKMGEGVVPPGDGDGQIRPVLKEAAAMEGNYFVTLEPHLRHAGQFKGDSGPDLFVLAIRKLKAILDDIGADYDAK